MLIMRTTDKDGKSYGGFQWPESGEVVAPDWNPAPVCGGGLHGLAHGMGDVELLNWDHDALWWVVDADDTVDIGGDKVKFPRCTIRYRGDRAGATQYLYTHDPAARAVVGLVFAGGDRATVSGGDGARVSGGDEARVSGGRGATVSGGRGATVSGGVVATVSGGDEARVSGGRGATVSGGRGATVSGGVVATVSGGDEATVSGGDGADVSGGDEAILQLRHWDGRRYRIITAYVGEDGIEPNTPYCLDDNGKFVSATGAQEKRNG